MRDASFIGYCGVDCSACPDFASEVCPGCRQSSWPDGDSCPPVACCTTRAIPFCGACDEFPCAMMAEFYEESDSHREAFQLMRTFREA